MKETAKRFTENSDLTVVATELDIVLDKNVEYPKQMYSKFACLLVKISRTHFSICTVTSEKNSMPIDYNS